MSGLLAASSCLAQSFPVHSAGSYQSFTQWLELNAGVATGMVTDAAGNAYISAKLPGPPQSGYVAKVAPDGTVMYNVAFSSYATGVALGDAGNVWIGFNGWMGKFDGQGNPLPGSLPFLGPVTTDAAFNLYEASTDTSGKITILKVDASGNAIGSFDTKVAGNVSAMAVDASGAVYVTGSDLASRFSATPGALHSGSDPNLHVFVLKVSAALNSLVYAAMVGGSGTDLPTAIAVDGAGDTPAQKA